MIKMEI